MILRFLLFFNLFIFTACSIVDVPKVEDAAFVAVPEDAKPAPISLRKIKVTIPRGSRLGSTSPRYPFICDGPWGEMFGKEVTRHIETGEFKRSFDMAMEGQGYDVTYTQNIMFDEDDDLLRTLYSIGAKIEDIKVDLCSKDHLFLGFFKRGQTGEAYMKVEWSVYDRLRRKTVYKTTTEGYSRLKMTNPEAIGIMLDDAFNAASHNLGADEHFYNLIVRGTRPPAPLKGYEDKYIPEDSDESVVIPKKPLSKTPVTKTMEQARRVAVLVQAGSGHGSGFFISRQGHILTNHHVVGNAEQVRIETPGKKHFLTARVIRRDKIRDVAVLKLDEVPSGLNIVTLPMRTNWPAVGEDVFAIGAPLYQKKLQDTVTKGIISAHRRNVKIFGTYMDVLQADVTIHGGNSGGPLLDANGNIVGLSIAGYLDPNDGTSADGLNLFVPIEVALERLDIAY